MYILNSIYVSSQEIIRSFDQIEMASNILLTTLACTHLVSIPIGPMEVYWHFPLIPPQIFASYYILSFESI